MGNTKSCCVTDFFFTDDKDLLSRKSFNVLIFLLSIFLLSACNYISITSSNKLTNTALSASAQSITATVSTTYTSDGSTRPDLAGTDSEGAIVTCTKSTDPAHGTVTINSNCSFVYVPATGYTGADSFTFKVSNGSLTSADAVVSITVSAVASGDTGISALPKLSYGLLFLEFASDASDSFGTYPFTATNGVTYVTRAGRAGKVAHFNGTDQYLSRAWVPLAADREEFSISLWFQTLGTGTQVIIDAKDTSGVYGDYLNIHLTDGVLTAGYSVGSGGTSLDSTSTTLNDGNWHHVVFVKNDKRTGLLYIDNALVATDANNSGSGQGIGPIDSDFYIGRSVEGTNFFNGYLDDIYVEQSPWASYNFFDSVDVTTMFSR